MESRAGGGRGRDEVRLDAVEVVEVLARHRGGPPGLTATGAGPARGGHDRGRPRAVLIRRGFLKRTPRGRVAADGGLMHVGVSVTKANQVC